MIQDTFNLHVSIKLKLTSQVSERGTLRPKRLGIFYCNKNKKIFKKIKKVELLGKMVSEYFC